MTKINSTVAGGTLPSQSASPSLPSPKPTLPRPEPLPLPLPRPSLDKFLTSSRSEKVATTQAQQLDSIRKGVVNGSVTEKEASKLLGQQAQIAEATSSATADGVITAKEAASLRGLQAQAGLSVFAASHNATHATPSNPGIAKEQAAQIGRIAQGVRSGSLTGAEANTLLKDQSEIAQEVVSAQSDGELDFIEQQSVDIRQQAASFEIGKEKGDAEKAPHAKRLQFPVLF
jgi:tellurite resistance protein